MAFPTFTMRELLEAGVHFGHTTRRWNPKMSPYIFGIRNGIHIIDLEQTVPLLNQALVTVREVVAGGGRVLFVGTKRQASDIIMESAKRCGQYYVNHRWLGGMLTNWKTISKSIKRLRDLDDQLSEANAEEITGLTKKELLNLNRERDKLERALGGIKDMGDLPNVLVVVDTNKEHIAIAEATKLNIPVIAVIDSNSDPEGITYPVPGNDDAFRAIATYCNLMADAVLDGIQQELISSGADVGEAEDAPAEDLPAEAPKAEAPAAAEQVETAPAEGAEAAPEAAPEAATEAATEAAAEAAPEAAPEKATEETPEKATEEAPEKATEETPEKAPEKATEETPEKATEEAPEKAPEKATEEAPEKATEEAPEEATEETPESTAETSAEEAGQAVEPAAETAAESQPDAPAEAEVEAPAEPEEAAEEAAEEKPKKKAS
jgi:small subunit ribosomal protein S2